VADTGTGQSAPLSIRRLAGDPIAIAILFCLVVTIVFLAAPAIDLAFSRLFYDPATGFAASRDPALRMLRTAADIAVRGIVLVLLLSVLFKIALPSRRSLVPPRVTLFLLSSLALGPGLLVNLILKDHWGRPRPVAIEAFGGSAPYVEVWRMTGYCARNCSFVAGEASSAIWLTALAFVVPHRYRLPVLLVTAIFALAASLNRIAFGGHFLSDVLLSWGLTALVIAILYRLILAGRPFMSDNDRLETALARLGNAIRRPFAGNPASRRKP
jgi:membrane-associated phospholipid phosphatase